jgi:hypothetical protein
VDEVPKIIVCEPTEGGKRGGVGWANDEGVPLYQQFQGGSGPGDQGQESYVLGEGGLPWATGMPPFGRPASMVSPPFHLESFIKIHSTNIV